MSAFLKCFIAPIPLKPIQPGKLQDYSYKSLMSRVLYEPPTRQTVISALVFIMTSQLGRCPEVLTCLANRSTTPATMVSSGQKSVTSLKYLELDVDVSEAAADPALQHLVIIVVCIAKGLLVALQGLLEDAQAQESVAHAETHLAVELQADGGALHVQAGLAVGHGLLEVTELLVAARQVQVAFSEVVRVFHLPGGVDLI